MYCHIVRWYLQLLLLLVVQTCIYISFFLLSYQYYAQIYYKHTLVIYHYNLGIKSSSVTGFYTKYSYSLDIKPTKVVN